MKKLKRTLLQYIKKYKKKKELYKICLAVASVVIFFVTYILVLPGIALEDSSTYWIKLENASEINTSDTYIITDKDNLYALATLSDSSNITTVATSVTTKGITSDNKTYYDITGTDINEYSYWKNSTDNSSNELLNVLSSSTNYLQLSTYYSTYITSSSGNSTKNITYTDTTDGYITISRASNSSGTYYLTFSNNSFSVAKDETTGTELNIYKQITISDSSAEDDDETTEEEDDTPEIEKWLLIDSTEDIVANGTYIIGYYNDSAYTSAGYNNNYIGIDDGNNIIRGEINFTENTDTTTYYTTDTDTSMFKWTFSTDITGGSLKNKYNNKYLVFGDTLSFSDTDPGGLSLSAEDGYWLIYSSVSGTDYYLKFNDSNNTYKFYTASGEYFRGMKIYKLDSNTSDDSTHTDEDIPEVTPTVTTYWERITDTSEINTTEEYLIIYNDTNIYGYNSGTTAGTVTVSEKGVNNSGKKYYDISGNTTNAYKWKFTNSGSTSKLQNVNSSSYYLSLSGSTTTNTSGTTNTFTYQSDSESWKITYVSTNSGKTYYLNYNGSTFNRSSTVGSSNNIYIYHQVNILVDINVSTYWEGTAPNENTTVYLYTKDNTTNVISKLLDENNNQYSLTLTPSNNWQGSFENIPINDDNNTYLLAQNKVAGYLINYSNEQTESFGEGISLFSSLSFTDNIANISITNTAGISLPSTGGCGVKIFYILGALFILLACLIEFIKRKYSLN